MYQIWKAEFFHFQDIVLAVSAAWNFSSSHIGGSFLSLFQVRDLTSAKIVVTTSIVISLLYNNHYLTQALSPGPPVSTSHHSQFKPLTPQGLCIYQSLHPSACNATSFSINRNLILQGPVQMLPHAQISLLPSCPPLRRQPVSWVHPHTAAPFSVL